MSYSHLENISSNPLQSPTQSLWHRLSEPWESICGLQRKASWEYCPTTSTLSKAWSQSLEVSNIARQRTCAKHIVILHLKHNSIKQWSQVQGVGATCDQRRLSVMWGPFWHPPLLGSRGCRSQLALREQHLASFQRGRKPTDAIVISAFSS
jgi:hypothetical protein